MKEQYWKYSLIIFIIGLGILLFRQAQPFMNGILGGFTLYILLRNFSNWLQTKIKPLLAVWMITIGVTLFILIPVSLFSWAIVSQISGMHFDTQAIIQPAHQVIDGFAESGVNNCAHIVGAIIGFVCGIIIFCQMKKNRAEGR